MELEFFLTLGGIGGAFWIPALIMFILTARRKMTCTAKTTALVTSIKTKGSSDGHSYHPVYEYKVDGITYTGIGAYISWRLPKVGTTVTIQYNPCRPQKSYSPGYDDKVLKILSGVFFTISCIPILICICIALRAGS
ncbi:MAG: DUF3592 domain-containing protein [Blautia sp.]|jgi:hypothetical protein